MINPPPLIDAHPGDPITSEGWNNIVAAVKTLFDHANRGLGTLSVSVKAQTNTTPIPAARVTLKPTGETGVVRTGHYAGADVQRFLVPELLPGAYQLVVEAAGFGPQTRDVVMDAEDVELTVELTPTEVLSAAPNLFGRPLADAIQVVSTAGFQLVRVVDSHGRDVAVATLDDQMRRQPVIGQTPEAGTPIPTNAPIQLGVAAPAEYATRVTVPDVRGLTVDQARAALEAVGLTLGTSTAVTTKPTRSWEYPIEGGVFDPSRMVLRRDRPIG